MKKFLLLTITAVAVFSVFLSNNKISYAALDLKRDFGVDYFDKNYINTLYYSVRRDAVRSDKYLDSTDITDLQSYLYERGYFNESETQKKNCSVWWQIASWGLCSIAGAGETTVTLYRNDLVTGYFGPRTETAVKNYQKLNNITSTGWVGSLTRASLKSKSTAEEDFTPRIAYWWGKINQHINTSTGAWETDPGGYLGADEDRLSYCKRFYPNTVSVSGYKQETIRSWREKGNIGGPYTASVQTYKCNIQEAPATPQPTPEQPATPQPTPEQPATPESKPLPIKFTAPINNNSTVFGNKYTVKWDFDQNDLYSLTNGYQYYMLLKVKNSSFYGSLVISSVNLSSKQAEIEIANNFSSGQTLYFELVRTDGQKVESSTFVYGGVTNMYENPIPDQYKNCSDGSKILQSQTCPTYQTCWDGSKVLYNEVCPQQKFDNCVKWDTNGICTAIQATQTCSDGSVIPVAQKCPVVQICWDGTTPNSNYGCSKEIKLKDGLTCVAWSDNGACRQSYLISTSQTQRCWDGSVIPITQGCISYGYKTCPDGTTIETTRNCPIEGMGVSPDDVKDNNSQYTPCTKGAVVNNGDKCPIDNFNAPYNGQVLGTDGYYRWCSGGSTWNAGDRSCKCPTGQAYNLSNQTCVNYSANVSLLNELKPSVLGATSYQFTRFLKKGMSGDDVKQLQLFLNNSGFNVDQTGYFGGMTKNSLKKYQEANADKILKPIGLKNGTGEFRFSTMKFINDKMLGN